MLGLVHKFFVVRVEPITSLVKGLFQTSQKSADIYSCTFYQSKQSTGVYAKPFPSKMALQPIQLQQTNWIFGRDGKPPKD